MSFQDRAQKAHEQYLFSQTDEGKYQALLTSVKNILNRLETETFGQNNYVQDKILAMIHLHGKEYGAAIFKFAATQENKERLLKDINIREFFRRQLDTDNFILKIYRNNNHWTVWVQLTESPQDTVEYVENVYNSRVISNDHLCSILV